MSVLYYKVRANICPNQLTSEINTGIGSPVCEYVRIDDLVNLTISFVTAISAPQETTLNSIITAHVCTVIATSSETVTSVATSQPATGLTITGGPITSTGTLSFVLANDLAALEGLTSTGFASRTSADTWVQRAITGTVGNIVVANGDGIAGNPTLNLATAGTAGTYATVTTDAYGRVTSGNATQTTTTGGTGLTSIGTANQVLGVNTGATSLEYKTITAGANITITPSAGTITIASTGGGSTVPAGANTNVQYNNSGAFGAEANFSYNQTTDNLTIYGATAAQTRLSLLSGTTIADVTQINKSTLYIEIDADATFEGIRTYFKRSTPGISGWITYHYDQNTPNIRVTDEDDDPPYIAFRTIGSGTYDTPQYNNAFGGRGPIAGRTTGFSWWDGDINGGTEIMSLDSNFLKIPTGTTGTRPSSPLNGMVMYNTTTNKFEGYENGSWSNLGTPSTINKNVVSQVITSSSTTNIINYTVPGGTLSIDNLLRIQLAGTWANSSGANRNCIIAVSYGGVVLWQDTATNLITGSIVGWNLTLMLASNNSVTAQTLNGVLSIGGTGGVTTGITGDAATDEINSQAILTGTSAVNSAIDQPLVVSVSFNGTGITWTKYFHTIEKL